MRKITLDGNKMKNKEDVHHYLKEELQIKEYYGNNLDALWDALISYDLPMKIRLIHYPEMIKNLGDYGHALINVFRDAEIVNTNFELEILKK